MERLANWWDEQFDKFCNWLLELLSGFLDWALELVEWIPQNIWAGILDGLASLIESIPVPQFLAQAGSFFGNIPSTIVYLFQFFAVAEGLGFITAALLLRFLVRRIPIIG
jgi:hypothetical protein